MFVDKVAPVGFLWALSGGQGPSGDYWPDIAIVVPVDNLPDHKRLTVFGVRDDIKREP